MNDRTSGKYISSQNVESFTGDWISNEVVMEIEFEITTKNISKAKIYLHLTKRYCAIGDDV